MIMLHMLATQLDVFHEFSISLIVTEPAWNINYQRLLKKENMTVSFSLFLYFIIL